MSATFYVSATVGPDGNFANCSYYSDKDGNFPLPGSAFSIPKDSGACVFEETTNSPLALIGATFSNLGGTPVMNSGNFCPANASKAIEFTMPTAYVSTKGVVLLFSNRDVVDNIYPSSDPQITNDAASPPTQGAVATA
ncbi:hypothetical protein SAMN05216359_103124 [Roseateles sp. YR242]|uniref:hypothetical protein n=1 Tax=Roseateles sp. YR242 TaxID=1855305 RepID=UPI0008ADA544|nr:hypothetical protein [Roseateles sp. YR242]SEK79868.1 hypothetical protein SAMN05216359_103124 [Roseateles sp. YR242]